jgi:hypothetical protein
MLQQLATCQPAVAALQEVKPDCIQATQSGSIVALAIVAPHVLLAATDAGTVQLLSTQMDRTAQSPQSPSAALANLDLAATASGSTQITHFAVAAITTSDFNGQAFVAAALARQGENALLHVLAGSSSGHEADMDVETFSALHLLATAVLPAGIPDSVTLAPGGSHAAVAFAGGCVMVYTVPSSGAAAVKTKVMEQHKEPNAGAPVKDMQPLASFESLPPGTPPQTLCLHWQLYSSLQPGQSAGERPPAKALLAYVPGSAELKALPLASSSRQQGEPAPQPRTPPVEQPVPAAKPQTPTKKQQSRAARNTAAAAAAASAAEAAAQPAHASEVLVKPVRALLCPEAIVGSARSAEGGHVLLALSNGALLLYSIKLDCVLAVSARLPGIPRCAALSCKVGASASAPGCMAAATDSAGILCTWDGQDGHLSVRQEPLPFVLADMVFIGSECEDSKASMLAQTMCGRIVRVDVSTGAITHQLSATPGLQCGPFLLWLHGSVESQVFKSVMYACLAQQDQALTTSWLASDELRHVGFPVPIPWATPKAPRQRLTRPPMKQQGIRVVVKRR